MLTACEDASGTRSIYTPSLLEKGAVGRRTNQRGLGEKGEGEMREGQGEGRNLVGSGGGSRKGEGAKTSTGANT